jgi:hypothetical protein
MNSAACTLPNFFIAGAPKTGTTSLYHWLSTHPEVYMSPVKEPSYFSFETRPENFSSKYQAMIREQMENVRKGLDRGLAQNSVRGIVSEWTDYLRLFTGATQVKAIGEASVCYLWSQTAARAIRERVPHARILLILRDPADRVFSQYLHYRSFGHATLGFRQHVERCLRSDRQLSPYNPILDFGMYAGQVERYFASFPRDQIRIWLYEETLKDPRTFHREVLEFLGVDPAGGTEIKKRHLEVSIARVPMLTNILKRARIYDFLRDALPSGLQRFVRPMFCRPRRSMHMSARDRAFLVDFYRQDVCRLEQLIGRDLSAWRSYDAPSRA